MVLGRLIQRQPAINLLLTRYIYYQLIDILSSACWRDVDKLNRSGLARPPPGCKQSARIYTYLPIMRRCQVARRRRVPLSVTVNENFPKST